MELDDVNKTIKGMYDKMIGGKLAVEVVGPAPPPAMVDENNPQENVDFHYDVYKFLNEIRFKI